MAKASSEESSSSSSDSSSDSEVEKQEERPSKKAKKTMENNPQSSLSSIPLETVQAETGGNSGVSSKQPIIVLLDQATLETIKNRKGVFELLNCDDHRELCKKKLHKDPNAYRPDILHQELLALLDSPLNKAGLLKVYISTTKNVLIDVNPSIRIPRTYKRFAGLMVQLLHKMKIKAASGSSGADSTLLKVIKNPFSKYLPVGTRCYGMSCEGTLYSPINLAKSILPLESDSNSPPTCLIVGAMSTGHVTIEDYPYIEKMISVSNYPLSGASALSRIMTGIEYHWGIV